ncbi:hypothetical protein BDV18DRAFT_160415 [Aspergillus unguis]
MGAENTEQKRQGDSSIRLILSPTPAQPTLLPSAIEDKPKYNIDSSPTVLTFRNCSCRTDMNHQQQILPCRPKPKPQLKRGFADSPPQSPSSAPITAEDEDRKKRDCPESDHNDKTYAEKYQERLLAYRASKEQNLKEPFEPRLQPHPCHSLFLISEGNASGCHGGNSRICFSGKSPGRLFDPESSSSSCPSSDGTISDCEKDDLSSGAVYSYNGTGNANDRLTQTGQVIEKVYAEAALKPRPQPQLQRIPNYQVTENHTPLSRDAIANILLQCAPQSTASKAWIAAHQAQRAAEERRNAAMKERGGLRKQVLQLRPKCEWTMNRAARASVKTQKEVDGGETNDDKVLKEEGCEGLASETNSNPPQVEARQVEGNADRGAKNGFDHHRRSYVFDEQDEQMIRVFKTSARLQVLMCDDEPSLAIAGRARRELRRYFDVAE